MAPTLTPTAEHTFKVFFFPVFELHCPHLTSAGLPVGLVKERKAGLMFSILSLGYEPKPK